MVKKVNNLTKFRLLLWKNYLIQRNHICHLICETIMPVICALIFLGVRALAEVKQMPAKNFKEIPIQDLRIYLEGEYKPDKFGQLPIFVFAYSPKNEFLERIILETQKRVGFGEQAPKGYENAKKMAEDLITNNYFAAVEFAVDLKNLETLNKKLSFKLRFPSELRSVPPKLGNLTTWSTDVLYPRSKSAGPRNPYWDDDGRPAGYFREGFIQIQNAIVMSYFELSKPEIKDKLPEIVMRRLPYSKYTKDDFFGVLQVYLRTLLMISFLPFVIHATKYIALEREKQLKQIMQMMGIQNWIHWVAWFVRSMIVIIVPTLLLIIFTTVPIVRGIAIFAHSDWSIIFVFFLLYSLSVLTFSFLMSVLCKKAATATVLAALLFYFLSYPNDILESYYNEMSTFSKALACLDLNVGMGYAVRIISGWEGAGEGAQWNNLYDPVNEDDNIPLGLVLFMMLLTAVLQMLLCLYIEQIFPGEYGVSKKWNFIFSRELWCRKKVKRQRPSEQILPPYLERINSDAFEQQPNGKRIGIEVRGLRKRYGSKWAVKNVTLNMYEDEITVLLGHNGAGKTTTILMLTGMTAPSGGTAKINGHDIRSDMEGARSSMGLCPQINVLFDDMSVANHLVFFSKLKGVTGKAVEVEVNRYLQIMQLTKKAKVLPTMLSGGMKRKLTLCNALCGSTKIVLCDEPSSGLDPAARRQLWDLIQSEKIGRTVLLTTHFMDEADVLGDRIAIMCDGEIKSHGSPFFLKKKFGSGYRLICVKKENCDVDGVTELLEKYIPDIQIDTEIGTELTYRLPNRYSTLFGQIFADLEANLENLGLNQFGVGLTSLEEVFMKIGAEGADKRKSGGADRDPENNKKSDEKKEKTNSTIDTDVSFDTASELTPQTTSADLTKRGSETAVANRRGTTESEALNMRFSDEDTISKQDEEEAEEERSRKEQEEKEKEKQEEERRKELAALEEAARKRDEARLRRQREAEERRKQDDLQKQRLHFEIVENESQENLRKKGRSLICNQWYAMFYKKFKYTLRNRTLVLFQILIGIFFVSMAGFTIKLTHLRDLPPMNFSLKQYTHSITYLEKTTAIEPNSLLETISLKYKELANGDGDKKHEVNFLTGTDGNGFEKLITDLSNKDQIHVNKLYLTAATIDKVKITIWFNNQPLHVAPMALNLLHNAIARALFGNEAGIEVTNYPLPFTSATRLKNIEHNVKASGTIFVLVFGFAMAFIIAIFVVPVIEERITHCKSLQFVSGVPALTYWLTIFLWDLFIATIVAILMFICLTFFNIETYSSFANLIQFFMLTFIFCVGVLPFTYVLSGLFGQAATGFAFVLIINIFLGVFIFLVFFIVDAILKSLEKKFPELLHQILVFSPHFSLINGWKNLYQNMQYHSACGQRILQAIPVELKCKYVPICCDLKSYYAYQPPGILQELLGILLTGLVAFLILILKDSGIDFKRICYEKNYKYKSADEVDEDVLAERNKVRKMTDKDRSEYSLVLDNLAKYYGKFLAVKFLALSIKRKECFGLLGVNGAGKTSTFRMLTGDVSISSGNAYVRGLSVRTHRNEVFRKIGYCPQFDALLEDLTGRELMFIFCLLRGIPRSKIKLTTEELAKALGFIKHLDNRSKTYSGGNKRKLSTAIALIGVPSVIYLDEPTTGLDPAAKRQLWNIICLVRDHGKLIVLTSHSMDECEALCTRLAIMVNGEFKCIGSTQHLKNKFSKGLVLKVQAQRTIETNRPDPGSRLSLEMQTNISRIKEAIFNKYAGAVIESEYQSFITIYIPLKVIKWSEIFTWLENNRADLKIEDYSISQTSLEEIFLDIAKTQKSDDRVKKKKICC